MRLQLLAQTAFLLHFVTASFSYDHDVYSKPEFVVLNDTLHYLLESQVSTYINSVKSITNSEIEFMKHNNDTYLCTYPVLTSQDLTTEDLQELKTWQKSELLEAKEYALQALYEGMMGQCIYYIKGWWSYSFCYGLDIKQFHVDLSQLSKGVLPDPKKADMLFVLGKFEKKPGGTLKYDVKIKNEDDVNYLSYTLDKGTLCDLTGKGRSTEMQFYCNPTQEIDSVLWIKEVRSCEYKIGISTKKICGNPIFAPPVKVNPHKIECRRIITTVELEELQAKKEEAKKLAAIQSENRKKAESKQQQVVVSNLLYNDLDFSGRAWKQLQLDPADSAEINIRSYHDDPNHTLTLLIKKISEMIREGSIKNANGKVITVKDEFSTIIKLVDLNEKDVLLIKVALIKGDLLIGIVSDEEGEGKEIFEMELKDDDDDELDEPGDPETEADEYQFLFVTTMAHAAPTDVATGSDEFDDDDFEPLPDNQKTKDVQQKGTKQDDDASDVNDNKIDDSQKEKITTEQVYQSSQDVKQVPLVADNEGKAEEKNAEGKVYYYYDGDEYLQDEEDLDDIDEEDLQDEEDLDGDDEEMVQIDEVVRDEL